MYKCPNCGGEMEFLPENGIIKCEYCGSEFSPEREAQDLKKTRKNAQEQTMPEGKVYTCSQCGASLYTTEETGVTFCSYCGSQAFLESRMKGEDGFSPDLIVPFQISKKQCAEIYKTKIKNAWFLPREMKSDTTIEKFRGIYMPCWVYTGEAKAEGDYTTSKTTLEGQFDVTRTYSVKVDSHGTYGGFVEDASSSFPDAIMQEISPFNMKSARTFQDTYMTGFYADIGNVPPDAYKDNIYGYLDQNIKHDLRTNRQVQNKPIGEADIEAKTSVKAKVSEVRKGFLPVWFLSNKNERTGLMSYAVINGLNGKIHADLPVDLKKYLLLSLLIAIPVFLILQFLTLKPGVMLVITMLLLAILMFFSTGMVREAYVQMHGLDDEGLLYLQQKSGIAQDPKKIQKIKKKKSLTKARGIGFGILCFILIPFLSAIITYLIDYNLIEWGFFIGIMAFVACVTSGKSTPKMEDKVSYVRVKLPFYVLLRAMALPLIGIIAGLAILIIAPAHDLYYYAVVLLCCILLILTMLRFLRYNNQLALRKPAQLGKRGGDEND